MQGRAATVMRLEGPESNVSRVSSELTKHEWVHFACSGLQKKKEPFGSAFALRDGHLAIERLIKCELESPEFAYLSACHTTTDGDDESADEVIRLASAMQFAGFQSVVGTMWDVDDGQTNLIAAAFYENFMTDMEAGELNHTRAAVALNKTMNTLANVSLDQRINYVHIGA